MSKKHFNALARALAYCRPLDYGTHKRETRSDYTWRVCCERIADFCYADNAEFNYDRFMRACEKWDGK